MNRVSNGIYSSNGTIIVPHQIIVRHEYSAMFSKGPPPLWLLHPGGKLEEYIVLVTGDLNKTLVS